ncbi:hypothetical protein IG631_05423 [Alternaria alternata]|nr:hypothetical protein IG631_05423 [Alternaria alternata]
MTTRTVKGVDSPALFKQITAPALRHASPLLGIHAKPSARNARRAKAQATTILGCRGRTALHATSTQTSSKGVDRRQINKDLILLYN